MWVVGPGALVMLANGGKLRGTTSLHKTHSTTLTLFPSKCFVIQR